MDSIERWWLCSTFFEINSELTDALHNHKYIAGFHSRLPDFYNYGTLPLAVVSTPSEDASSSASFGAFGNAEPASVTLSPDRSKSNSKLPLDCWVQAPKDLKHVDSIEP